MTRILGSVRNPQEAELLLRTPVAILDLKDPARGALGAADPVAVRQVLDQVQGRRHVSAAAGSADDGDVLEQARRLSLEGVDFVKIGFSRLSQQVLLPEFRAAIMAQAQAVAVLFADSPEIDPMQWIRPARMAGFAGLMLDTADKHSGPLDRHMDLAQVTDWVRVTKESGLLCGLAGRLDAESARCFLSARPDYLGFRSALCNRSVRTEPICLETTFRLLEALRESSAELPDLPPMGDMHLPLAPGHAL